MDPVASAPDCPQCGRVLRPEAAWCSLCFTPAPSRAFSGPLVTRRCDDPAPVERVQHRTSRWAGSSVSFGPVGRVLMTALLLCVGPALLVGGGAGSVVAGIVWIAVVLPWALRDVWREVRVRR
ncbi:hypothetical protein [Kineococcus mangrovi]|uniref:hypothetical protein n=1 Tax=Kineococcus mangrovi TaxID=1660183 RepID=UPI003D7C5D06